jgi:ABC-type bacteriocin/lantibiotic exporter with double-glycine peptidase domain
MGLIIALLVSKYTNKYISTFGVISNNAVSNYNLKIGNFFDGFKSIYFHDNRHEVLGKILESSSLYSSARQKLVILTSIPKIFFELILVASLVILVLMTGGTSPQVISDLVGVAYLAFRIIPFLSQLSAVGMQISYHIPILEQIAELNNPNQSVIDTEIYTEKTRDLVSHKLTISNLRTDVDCLYNHDKTLNINLYSGDILWIDGVSGVGKSTLLDYIVGLHPSPNSLINLNDMLLQRSNCAYSTQTGFAFEADFKSNMFLSSLTSEMIKDASDFFKIDTESILGLIDCKKLSGGQVQKISLLRVLFSNRSVLVFDEPTNGFDDESVKVFFQLLLKWGGDKISIIVSHDSRFFKIASKNLTLRANH